MDDLKIRQKCEEMIAYGYVALRQFPKFERHGRWFCSEILGLSAWLVNPHLLTPGRLAVALIGMGGVRKQFEAAT